MGTLDGLVVGVTAARKGPQLVATLRRRGAEVLHGPTLAGDLAAPADELAAMVESIIEAPPELFAASTGRGMALLADAAEQGGRAAQLGDAITGARVLARGAKARGGLQRLGVTPDWTAADELDRQVVEEIRRTVVPPQRVVVQAHGAGGRAYDHLGDHDLDVRVIRPYVSAPLEDLAPAQDLLDALVNERLDAVVFTSPGAVHGLADVARQAARSARVSAVLRDRVAVVAVGPVTGAAVEDEGWTVAVVPESHRTGAMVRAFETWREALRRGG